MFFSGGGFFTSTVLPQSSEGKALAKDLLSASQLVEAGVRVAVATPRGISIRELLMRANLARRGGMSPENALRAITLNAAEILGVDDRVGSLAVGKDADFAILNGAPLNHETRVLATWVDGELAWESSSFSATVIAVDELHLGDGTVLSPGEVLMQSGRIVEVGRHVARPRAAKVVRGAAAMPGAIDAWGHLGLEGSSKSFNASFDLSRIVEPGSDEDREVAASGVTTVNMAPKSASHGSTFMTYKPAGSIPSSMILSNPAGVWLVWDHSIPSMAGAAVRDILGKAEAYKKKWEEYEAKLAVWTPPAPEADDGDDDEDEDDGAEEDEDDEKKKKKPKDKPDAIGCTGTWESANARLRLIEKEGALEGYLRLDGISDLITVSGTRDDHGVSLNGQSGPDSVSLTLTQEFEENDVDQPRLEGQYTIGEAEPQDVTWPRTGTDYPMASMPERRKVDMPKPPKGAPKSPGINPGLEPIRQAMLGKGTVLVSINNSEQLNECLSVFKQHGIRPVLAGSARPSSSHAGLISGVLLGRISSAPPPAGIPFMMRTRAEAGAADLLNDVSLEVGRGLSPTAAVRALTGYPAEMLGVSHRVGLLKAGRDADLVLFDGPPLHPASQVLKVWVNGKEVSR
jgi:imidazolonepropionase-like amidohydrolase